MKPPLMSRSVDQRGGSEIQREMREEKEHGRRLDK